MKFICKTGEWQWFERPDGVIFMAIMWFDDHVRVYRKKLKYEACDAVAEELRA